MIGVLCIAILMSIGTWKGVDASHFRGGTVSWKYLGQTGNVYTVEFNYRFGWRRDWHNPGCNAAAVSSQIVDYAGGSWRWAGNITSYSTANQTTGIKCTTYDNTDNWAYGYNSFITTVIATGPFHVSYVGGAWISAMFGSGGWSVSATNIDFATRSDTGTVNNPPRTLSRPIVRLIQGCSEDIAIRYLDDDNDIVRCRYAGSDPNAPVDECSGACNGPSNTGYSHFTLNETTCTIAYDGGGGTYLIAVSLVLEDYPRTNITLNGTRSVSTSDSLSQIPLQFIVQITPSASCNVVPTYPSSSIQEGAAIAIPRNGALNTTVYAYPSATTLTISQFVTIGPLGLQSSAAFFLGNNLYGSTLTWFPTSTQGGSHTVCYYAVDSGGVNGKQICFTLTAVVVQNPCDLNNGGCSDICTPSGSFSYCSCSMPCWSLGLDGKTCSPNMNLTCDGEAMRVSIDQCASNRTIVAGHSVNYITRTECQSSVVGGRHSMSLSPLTCGIRFQTNPVQVQYVSHLWVWDALDTGSSVITRGKYRIVPVACSLSSSSNLTGSFVPQLPFSNESFPVDVNIQGIGSFSLYFQFYRSSTYRTALSPSEYPLQVTVSERIHFSLGAVGQQGFVFFTQECVASSTSGTEVLTYTFIRDGCFLDPTLEGQPSNNSMENRFSLQAFEFENNLVTARQNAEISIQCSVLLCDAADSSTRCFKGCISPPSRRKRSSKDRVRRNADEDDDDDDDTEPASRPSIPQSPLQDVNARLILLIDATDDNGDAPGVGTSDSPSYLNWILIGIGGALLLIAVFVAYRVLKSRRFRSTRKPLNGDVEFWKSKDPRDA